MKRNFMAAVLALACALTVVAQKQQTKGSAQVANDTSASATQGNKNLKLDSGTKVSGQLQNTLDVRKAKVGDQVVLKTTNAVKQGGQTVVNKGSRLIGHVTAVEAKARDNGASRIGVLFDQLDTGSLTLPITATISSITQATTQARSGDDALSSDIGATSMSSSSAGTQRSSAGGNGGLLGGVTNTAGGVVNTAGSTVGGVANGATGTVGNTVHSTTSATGGTTAGLGRTLGHIQISESSSNSAEGGSLLTLQGDNLRLEKGTTFNIQLSQSASAGTQP
jgi:hypothetical protein